jgi:hypothetical protein
MSHINKNVCVMEFGCQGASRSDRRRQWKKKKVFLLTNIKEEASKRGLLSCLVVLFPSAFRPLASLLVAQLIPPSLVSFAAVFGFFLGCFCGADAPPQHRRSQRTSSVRRTSISWSAIRNFEISVRLKFDGL